MPGLAPIRPTRDGRFEFAYDGLTAVIMGRAAGGAVRTVPAAVKRGDDPAGGHVEVSSFNNWTTCGEQ